MLLHKRLKLLAVKRVCTWHWNHMLPRCAVSKLQPRVERSGQTQGMMLRAKMQQLSCVLGLRQTVPKVPADPRVCQQRDPQPKWKQRQLCGGYRETLYDRRGSPSTSQTSMCNYSLNRPGSQELSTTVDVIGLFFFNSLMLLFVLHLDRRCRISVLYSEEHAESQRQDASHRGPQWDIFQQSHRPGMLQLHGKPTETPIQVNKSFIKPFFFACFTFLSLFYVLHLSFALHTLLCM